MADNSTHIRLYIRKVLYPTSQFKANLFPNIETIIFTHLSKVVKSSFRARNILHGNNISKIERFLDKHLNFSYLLQNEQEVVVLCFHQFIQSFVAFKTFDSQRVEDLTQDILAKLLTEKKAVLRRYGKENFKKHKKVVSFFSVLVSYIYKEVLNDKKYRELSLDMQKKFDTKPSEMQDTTYLSFAMEEDLNRLKIILDLYYQLKDKLIMSLKCKYKIQLAEDDFEFVSSTVTFDEIKHLTSSPHEDKSTAKSFEMLSGIFNRHYKTNQSVSAYEKWIYRRELEIMNKLNILHNAVAYDLSNTQTLLEYYLVGPSQSSSQIIPMNAN